MIFDDVYHCHESQTMGSNSIFSYWYKWHECKTQFPDVASYKTNGDTGSHFSLIGESQNLSFNRVCEQGQICDHLWQIRYFKNITFFSSTKCSSAVNLTSLTNLQNLSKGPNMTWISWKSLNEFPKEWQNKSEVLERLRDTAVQPRERGGERGSTVREFQVFSSGKTSQKMMPKKLVM